MPSAATTRSASIRCPPAECDDAVDRRTNALRACHDLGAMPPRRRGERIDDLLADDAEHPFARIPVVHRQHAVITVRRTVRVFTIGAVAIASS